MCEYKQIQGSKEELLSFALGRGRKKSIHFNDRHNELLQFTSAVRDKWRCRVGAESPPVLAIEAGIHRGHHPGSQSQSDDELRWKLDRQLWGHGRLGWGRHGIRSHRRTSCTGYVFGSVCMRVCVHLHGMMMKAWE